MIDFRNITPCGGNCMECEYFQNNECKGCNTNDGKCVELWENGCKIYDCCQKHDAAFCGLCKEFPCEWLKQTLTWDEDGIKRLYELKKEYRSRNTAFSLHLQDLWNKIGTHGIMTLSAASGNRVTSRPMSMVIIDGRFFCQTDETYLKCRQIVQNPNAAVCHKNFSIEGICRNIGKPIQHDFFIRSMKEYFANAVERWFAIPTECVLEIIPTLIYSWDYEDDTPYMEYWDFKNLNYKKEYK